MTTTPSLVDPDAIPLGHITCPSGTFVLVDAGMLGLWSHDRPPLLDPDDWGPTADVANGAVDLRASGPDAAEAVRRVDRGSGRGSYVFDIPAAHVTDLQRRFAEVAAQHGLSASLDVLPERVPHRARVAQLTAGTAGFSEIPFHGIWAIAGTGVPRDRRLGVFGRRVPEGPEAGRWASVWLQLSSAPVARSESAGHVLVDRARIMFADVDALGAWEQDEAIDGLADVVFWGRDGAEVAALGGAPRVVQPHGEAFGWIDLPLEEAIQKANSVAALRSPDRKFALDFRPHSHAYQLLQQVRATATESGQVAIGGAELCGFMTSWGDGAFEVFRDLDSAGALVRVRIQMETPARLEIMRQLNRR